VRRTGSGSHPIKGNKFMEALDVALEYAENEFNQSK